MFVLIFWMMGGLIGAAAAQKKGFSMAMGALGGVLLGPLLAWLLFFVSGVTKDDASRKCRYCAEFIKQAATVCKHCGRDQKPAMPTRKAS